MDDNKNTCTDGKRKHGVSYEKQNITNENTTNKNTINENIMSNEEQQIIVNKTNSNKEKKADRKGEKS